MITTTCQLCKKEFKTYPSLIKMGYDKFCSRECANKAKIGKPSWHSGKQGVYSKDTLKKMSKAKIGNIPWNKGKKLPQLSGKNNHNWKRGYYLGKNGYYYTSDGRLLHRVIIEKYISRKLCRGEVVHHINGIRTDNRIENLELISSQSKHLHKEWKTGKMENCKKGWTNLRLAPYRLANGV